MVTFSDSSVGSPTIWQWGFGDGNSSISQNPTHAYVANGNYNVCLVVSDQLACSDTFCESVSIILNARAELTKDGYSIYPNPTMGLLTVSWDDVVFRPDGIKVVDALGRQLINIGMSEIDREHYVIDLGHLPAGLYFIELKKEGTSLIRKLILEK